MLDTLTHDAIAPTTGHNAAPILQVRDLSLWYDRTQALDRVTLDLYPGEILALIGPSGCGKSTFIKCLNRMHDNTRGVRIDGNILFDGIDVMAPTIDPPRLRRRFGWVAQKPNPFVASIYDNVAYGARLHGIAPGKPELAAHVERCLRQAHLWDEVKDILQSRQATQLSGGQQQRLCIARALSTNPDVLLMDEPTGSIDPVATEAIEDLIRDLSATKAIIIVTHSMMQARRIADRVAYFHLGRLLEIAPTAAMFTDPQTPEARGFISGAHG